MPADTGTLEAYRAGREGALVVDLAARGRLLLEGATCLALLHRVTTNDIRALEPGAGAASLMVNGKGRILDRLTILCRDADVVVLTAAGRREATGEALGKYIVFEQIEMTDVSETTFLAGLYGPMAGKTLAQACASGVGSGSAAQVAGDAALAMPAFHHLRREIAGFPVTVIREPGFAGPAFLLMGAVADEDGVRAGLRVAGAGHGLQEIDPAGMRAAWEALRIEAGLPAPPHEISEAWNPLEMRQEDALAFDKGCYVGQEVIARLRTYDKVRRRLVRLEIDGAEDVPAGAAIREGGGPEGPAPTSAAGAASPVAGDSVPGVRGRITSAAARPGQASVVALAVIEADRRDDSTAGAGDDDRRGAAGGEARTLIVITPAGERRARVMGDPATAVDVRVDAPRSSRLSRRRFRS